MTPIVVDLGFGDGGKGAIVDWLVRRDRADVVVRFNGGAQAGHNVVTPEGRHHTFAQFGAGTFVPGVRTWLGPGFVLHPGALLVEARHLARAGVPDALDRVTIDPRALVISPFQQAAGRLRELARGPRAHGTCGVGVGEAVSDALEGHDDVLRAADLADRDRLVGALRAQQERKRALPVVEDPRALPEARLLADPTAVERIVASWDGVAPRVGPRPAPGRWVMEGAQGVLLDETWGFHPHTTWSDCTPRGAVALLDGRPARVIGVIRAYATRHGAGPFPTWDPRWSLPEPHNSGEGWQGAFRIGPLDLVLLRYALEVAPVDELAITCLDLVPDRVPVCVDYDLDAPGVFRDGRLIPGAADDRSHRARLGLALRGARPRLSTVPRDRLSSWIEAHTGVPVRVEGLGATCEAKRVRSSALWPGED